MLLKRRFLDGIADGSISLAFRRWKRPTVRTGGTLRTPIGVLAIESVEQIDEKQIKATHARQAGFASRDELLAELNKRAEGQLYRIQLRLAGTDPRATLRRKGKLSDGELAEIAAKLRRMDDGSRSGPWTREFLRLIDKHPQTLAAQLAEQAGLEKAEFKRRVRRLKELGLTESLKVGYRLSPRGKTVFAHVKKAR